ncbi:hypothetical protein COOONC_16404 [Cooperia oncophora]
MPLVIIIDSFSGRCSLQLTMRRDKKQAQGLKRQANKLLNVISSPDDSSSESSALHVQLTDYVLNEVLRMAPECDHDPYDG